MVFFSCLTSGGAAATYALIKRLVSDRRGAETRLLWNANEAILPVGLLIPNSEQLIWYNGLLICFNGLSICNKGLLICTHKSLIHKYFSINHRTNKKLYPGWSGGGVGCLDCNYLTIYWFKLSDYYFHNSVLCLFHQTCKAGCVWRFFSP